MKEIDDTPLPENESETRRETDELLFECIKHLGEEVKEALEDRDEVIRGLMKRVANLESEVADLHHRRRVSRQQTVNQDPEWYC